MNLQKLRQNILFKITSLNAVVIILRLIISVGIQRLLALSIGEAGIAKVGQLRNLIEIVGSIATLGTFNGVVKNVAEFKDQNEELQKLFNTTYIFGAIGSLFTGGVLIGFSNTLAMKLFDDPAMQLVIVTLALVLPIFALNRLFLGIINGVSAYKTYAKIDLFGYLLSAGLTVLFLFQFNLIGVLMSIVLAPIIQVLILFVVFGKSLKTYIKISLIRFEFPYARELFAFALMSFVSTVLINYIELDIRTMITNTLSYTEAGNWTGMSFISKNYMVFSSGLFTLYVIPKFAQIYELKGFKKEVFHIYKTILPLFGVGMVLVYVFRSELVDLVYPNFTEMEPLFKWQLLGDFIRLAALVISHQFLAKKMVKSFVITEVLSLSLFYVFVKILMPIYGIEGVAMAHFYRYVVYFGVVFLILWLHFRGLPAAQPNE
ncbi:MAG: O-antigen translocase, partial [Gelidibacter sp.]